MVLDHLNRRTTLLGLAGLGVGAAGIASGEFNGAAASRAGPAGQAQAGGAACDWVVESGDSIQATVDDAEDGDTICVEPGTYAESVTVDVEDLTLRATESREAVIDASGAGTGVRIEADGVTLEGFEVAGDGGTTSGVSIVTSNGATADITIRDNHLHGMAKAGGGGPFGFASWGLLSWGDTPLSGVLVEDNHIEDIGGGAIDLGSLVGNVGGSVGIGIGLEEVEGDRPRGGAVIRRNTLEAINDLEVTGLDMTLPGVGIAVQPLDGASSGAGEPATDVHRNAISSTSMDVVLGEVGLTRVLDNE